MNDSVETFGIVDVVEAFTAMRHELKLQSKEGRKLIQTVELAVSRLEDLAQQREADSTRPDSAAAPAHADLQAFAEALAEIDETVHRAVDAAAKCLDDQHIEAIGSPEPLAVLIDQVYQRQPAWVRWVARRFHRQLSDVATAQQHRQETLAATLQGLRLMQQRVAKLTEKSRIRRVDVLGKVFDPHEMNALEAVSRQSLPSPTDADRVAAPQDVSIPSPDLPRAGEVIEQLRPAYYWNDTLLHYAQVRIVR